MTHPNRGPRSTDHMLSNVDERWFILAVLFLARTAMGFQFQAVAALSSSVITDFSIDYTQLGLLIGLYLFPGIVIAYPGGLLGQYFGDKRIAAFGMALMVAGGLLTATEGYPVVLAGRLISGVGAALLNVLLTKMTIDWFIGREIGTALAVLVSSWPVGIGVALVTLPWLAANSSASTGFAATAAVAALVLVLVVAVLSRAAGRGPATAVKSTGASPLVARRVQLGLPGGRCVDVFQCRLHPDPKPWSSAADVERIVSGGRRINDELSGVDNNYHDPLGRRFD